MKQDNLRHLQTVVDETVRTLGGYWIPLSGLARVMEELGELGELILKKDFGDEFSTELSDVMIITICVANQYCARLGIPQAHQEDISRFSLEELYLSLAKDCGEFARIVNSYEGNKKLKPTEHPATIEKQAAEICFDIISIAEKMNLDIVQLVEKTMLKVRKRDKDRFDFLYDPSLSLSHDEYIQIMKPSNKVWGLRNSNHNSLTEDLIENEDTIIRFLKFGQIEKINELIIKISRDNYDTSNLGKYNNLLKARLQNNFVVITRV